MDVESPAHESFELDGKHKFCAGTIDQDWAAWTNHTALTAGM